MNEMTDDIWKMKDKNYYSSQTDCFIPKGTRNGF